MTPAYIERLCRELDDEILALGNELEEAAGDPDVCALEFSAMFEAFCELEGRRLALAAEHEA